MPHRRAQMGTDRQPPAEPFQVWPSGLGWLLCGERASFQDSQKQDIPGFPSPTQAQVVSLNSGQGTKENESDTPALQDHVLVGCSGLLHLTPTSLQAPAEKRERAPCHIPTSYVESPSSSIPTARVIFPFDFKSPCHVGVRQRLLMR
jgi:hypothetical protein